MRQLHMEHGLFPIQQPAHVRVIVWEEKIAISMVERIKQGNLPNKMSGIARHDSISVTLNSHFMALFILFEK